MNLYHSGCIVVCWWEGPTRDWLVLWSNNAKMCPAKHRRQLWWVRTHLKKVVKYCICAIVGTVQYSPLHPCFFGNNWVLFSVHEKQVVDYAPYSTGGCKMMFPIKLPCLQYKLLGNYYCDQSEWSNPRPLAASLGSGYLWTINPYLVWYIYTYINK